MVAELSEEERERVRREKLLERILRNYRQWEAFVESEGLLSITVYGEEFHFCDILHGLELLPPRQKEAVQLLLIEDHREVDAAKMMGFTRWSTNVQQYKNLGVRKLLALQDSPELMAKELAKKRRREKEKRAKSNTF